MQGFLEREADDWWASRTVERKIQIYQWVEKLSGVHHTEVEGQQQLPMRIRTE